MPSLPIFPANESTVIPEKVYDRIWVKQIIIHAPDPNGEVRGNVKLTKYGMFPTGEQDENGNNTFLAETWDESNDIWIKVEDMLQKSEEDSDMNMALQALLAYVYKLGVMEGVITNPNPTTTPAPVTTTSTTTTTEEPAPTTTTTTTVEPVPTTTPAP